jgi:hypothetical protein
MIAFVCPIKGNPSSEQVTSIAMVLQERVDKGQFGRKRAFFLESGASLLYRCSNQSRFSGE